MKTIKAFGFEIETEIHNKNKIYAKCEKLCPKGWSIPTYHLIQKLRNSKYCKTLHLDNTWEFVINPDKINKQNGYVVWFGADSGGAGLGCDGGLTGRDSGLGVRYVRRIKK